jgi:hypothetical protein
MPDTGAPWNIPYVDPTDLVRDYPQASEDLADAVAAGLSAAGNAGIGSNVVQAIKTDTFTASTATFVTITGLSVTITPTSDTSKILLIGSVNAAADPSLTTVFLRYMRGATPIGVGDADGSRRQVSNGPGTNNNFGVTSTSFVILDSPGVDTAVTYTAEISGSVANSVVVNRSPDDSDSGARPRSVSSLTAIEVAV